MTVSSWASDWLIKETWKIEKSHTWSQVLNIQPTSNKNDFSVSFAIFASNDIVASAFNDGPDLVWPACIASGISQSYASFSVATSDLKGKETITEHINSFNKTMKDIIMSHDDNHPNRISFKILIADLYDQEFIKMIENNFNKDFLGAISIGLRTLHDRAKKDLNRK